MWNKVNRHQSQGGLGSEIAFNRKLMLLIFTKEMKIITSEIMRMIMFP